MKPARLITSSSVAAHVGNLQHGLGVFLDLVFLVGVSAINVLHASAQIILLGIVVQLVRG